MLKAAETQHDMGGDTKDHIYHPFLEHTLSSFPRAHQPPVKHHAIAQLVLGRSIERLNLTLRPARQVSKVTQSQKRQTSDLSRLRGFSVKTRSGKALIAVQIQGAVCEPRYDHAQDQAWAKK